MIRVALVVLGLVCCLLLLLVAVGVGIGFALHGLIPAIDVQFGVLAGVVVAATTLVVFVQTFTVLATALTDERIARKSIQADRDSDEDEDSDDDDEPPPAPQFKRGWDFGREWHAPSRRRRKRS